MNTPIDLFSPVKLGFHTLSNRMVMAPMTRLRALEALNPIGLAYVHLMEPNEIDLQNRDVLHPVTPLFRPIYQGTLITNGNYTKETANAALASGDADIVSFGKLFLANPDLPKRFELNAPLNEPSFKTFYGSTEEGYTDYPFLERVAS